MKNCFPKSMRTDSRSTDTTHNLLKFTIEWIMVKVVALVRNLYKVIDLRGLVSIDVRELGFTNK